MLGFLKSKTEKNKTKKSSGRASSTASPYSAVKIICKTNIACNAAQSIANTHFLSREAPFLPLENCTQSNQCRCKYQHMADRRVEARRNADFGLPGKSVEVDQRNRRDRRVADYAY